MLEFNVIKIWVLIIFIQNKCNGPWEMNMYVELSTQPFFILTYTCTYVIYTESFA